MLTKPVVIMEQTKVFSVIFILLISSLNEVCELTRKLC